MDVLKFISELNFYVEKIRWVFWVIGFCGNLLMFVVYSRPSLIKLSLSTYIRAMAVSYMIINLNCVRISLLINFKWYDYVNYSEFTCKLLPYLLYLPAPLTAWFEVMATLDRFLTIVYKNRFKFIRKPRFRLLVVLIIITFHCIIYSFMIFSAKYLRFKNKSLNYCLNMYIYLLDLIDFIDLAALPFIIMLIFSVATILGVARSRKNSVNRLAGPVASQNRFKSRDIKFGITLICLNLTFLILNAPNRIDEIFNLTSLIANDNPLNMALMIHGKSIIHDIQYSTCFYIQLAVNNLVRKEFCGLCKSCVNNLKRLFMFFIPFDRSIKF